MSKTVALPDASVVARLTTERAEAELISDAFAEGFDTEQAVGALFEEPQGRWSVAIHFRDPPNEAAVRGLVALVAGPMAANAVTFERLAAEDWVQASLATLTPVEAGRFVVHGAHDRARIKVNRIGIEIAAALAFGTGHHGTTRGCLLALDRIVKHRARGDATRAHTAVLDVGTGSGVLAIAAARALRRPVLASDIDPRAVTTARANARLNRAAPFVEVRHAAGILTRPFRVRAPYGLILANILLEPIRRLATPMSRLVAPGGRVVLSGLLAAQARAALANYRARGLVFERRIALEGWATLVLARPKANRRGRRAVHRLP
jgi:ribosomal protein L11 methyltransferase